MAKIWLEYNEDMMELTSIGGEDDDDSQEEDGDEEWLQSLNDDWNDDNILSHKGDKIYTNDINGLHVSFTPIWGFRNPIEDSLELEVDFDPADIRTIHFVVIRYNTIEDDKLVSGKWYIHSVYNTRRKALKVEEKIRNEELEIIGPWSKDNSTIEAIYTASVDVED